MIHCFQDCLQYSHDKEGSFDYIYHKYFKTVSNIERVTDTKRQKNGIDTIITLDSGEIKLVQEKWRERTFTDDFLIEYCSVEQEGICVKPGWIYTIDADYIFVVYGHSRIVKIYSVAQLKLAWSENKEQWIYKYNLPPAQNEGYYTHNVAVPCNILEQELLTQMTLTF